MWRVYQTSLAETVRNIKTVTASVQNQVTNVLDTNVQSHLLIISNVVPL